MKQNVGHQGGTDMNTNTIIHAIAATFWAALSIALGELAQWAAYNL